MWGRARAQEGADRSLGAIGAHQGDGFPGRSVNSFEDQLSGIATTLKLFRLPGAACFRRMLSGLDGQVEQ